MSIALNNLRLFLPALLCSICTISTAQKLPNKQESSIYAPADIKIDGNTKEWKGLFQAYNKATEVFYTVSNDADHLYLVLQANDPDVIQKIMPGGITFTVSNNAKNSTVAPIAITYPLIPFQYALVKYSLKPNGPLTDSAVLAVNRQISDHLKEIRITGVKEIPESSVSVYNDQGILAVQHIDNKKAYTYELAIPLKFIQPVINDAGVLKYNIQVNGIDLKTTKVYSGRPAGEIVEPSESAVSHGMDYETSPTYFSSEYTLAKKPN